ncbi:MAG: dihydrolipoyl dehydrogenase [Desulfobacterales bacterium]|nr:dihydrolipoyl dehydrogenase [Desulfobacterales bacterium]
MGLKSEASKKIRKKPDKTYDVIVIGSGSGMAVVENAIQQGLRVALVDKGPAGGTCLNVGCIPSKMLVSVADRIMEIREADRFGIEARIESIDFSRIMKEMRDAVIPDHQQIHRALKSEEKIDYYEGTGHFVAPNEIAINNHRIRGDKIFIAAGSRPVIPEIPGLDRIAYLTNETLLKLEALPESMVIIGGGYIACEYGHFFSALGTDVTIVQNRDRLLPDEEPEISEILAFDLANRVTIYNDSEVDGVQPADGKINAAVRNLKDGKTRSLSVEHILVAAGRRSNANLLQVENAGLETDANGFIRTDAYLQTSRKGIWAFGDIIGRQMFTHTANAEADIVWDNAMNGERESIDYDVVPRAVFTYPPVGAVGLTAEQAAKVHEILVGTARYGDVAKGMALREDRGMAKVVLEKESLKLLGFHIIGPHAPILIQEVANAMAIGGQLGALFSGQHIHPALTELIPKTFGNLSEPG